MDNELFNGFQGKKEINQYHITPKMGFVDNVGNLKYDPYIGYRKDNQIWHTETYTELYDPTLWSKVISCRDDLRKVETKIPKTSNKFKVNNIGRYANNATPILPHMNNIFVTQKSGLS